MEDPAPASCTTSTRTILWCVPRSGSTALAKCLSGVDGCEIWFEPFCFCFVAKVKAQKFLGLTLDPDHDCNAHQEVFQRAGDLMKQFNGYNHKADHLSYTSVKQKLECLSSPHVLVKEMAFAVSKEQYHLIPKGYRHSFMIRHPLRVFHSNRRDMITYLVERDQFRGDPDQFDMVQDDPLMTPGLLFKDIYDLWCYVREKLDPNPTVIDGDDLLTNPDKLLPKYCQAIGLPYDDSLLTWDGSPESTSAWKSPLKRGDDLKSVCESFYKKAMTSTKFFPPNPMPSRDHVTPDVIKYTDEVIEYYNEMHKKRLQVM